MSLRDKGTTCLCVIGLILRHSGKPHLWKSGNPLTQVDVTNALKKCRLKTITQTPNGDSPIITPFEAASMRAKLFGLNSLYFHMIWTMIMTAMFHS